VLASGLSVRLNVRRDAHRRPCLLSRSRPWPRQADQPGDERDQEDLAGQHLEHRDYRESIVAVATPVDGAEVDLLRSASTAPPHQLVKIPHHVALTGGSGARVGRWS
jgi:hypothetical protein